MAPRLTEALHEMAIGLDDQPDSTILNSLLRGQQQALTAVEKALPKISAAADLMVQAIAGGGRLIYAAAGSSGLMALADGAELAGTYGIAPHRIRLLMAGGVPVDAAMPGATEDDDGSRAAADITSADTVIAISASGSTAYPTSIAQVARAKGARVICIANNPDAAMFVCADVAICLQTPPEVIAGSTRLGAGTAQKATLNMMSTLMGIRLGHVHDGLMVNLVADNAKLRQRAAGIVQQIANVDATRAETCLKESGGAVKPAVLLALGVEDLPRAETLLRDSKGILRAAIAHMA